MSGRTRRACIRQNSSPPFPSTLHRTSSPLTRTPPHMNHGKSPSTEAQGPGTRCTYPHNNHHNLHRVHRNNTFRLPPTLRNLIGMKHNAGSHNVCKNPRSKFLPPSSLHHRSRALSPLVRTNHRNLGKNYC